MSVLMTMIGQNGNNYNLNKILLVDSSFKVFSLNESSHYKKIITFDFESHKAFSEHGIQHEVSDNYLSDSELHELQKKTYELSKWSKQEEISSLLTYKGINLGNLLYNDFIDFIAGFLKKFAEIAKIIQKHQNHEFVASVGLFDIVKILSNNVTSDNKKTVAPQTEIIKHSYQFGKKSISITVSKRTYLKLKNTTEFLLQKVFGFDKPKPEEKYVLLVEFDPTKYKTLILAPKKHSLNFLLYNRRWPTVWNLESFNVVRKSNCRIATYKTLVDTDLETKINQNKAIIRKKLIDLWSDDFFTSYFTFNNVSFWEALRPFFEKKLGSRIQEAIQEIESANKLFTKYKIFTVLVLSEIGFNEQIMIHLAKKNGIRVILMQHGVPYETPEASERNNLSGLFPNLSDSMIVWGNLTKSYLVTAGIPSSKLMSLGNPAYDELFNKKNTLKEEIILLATSPPMKDFVYDNLVETNERYQNTVREICKIVSGMNQKLVIKLHPSLVDFDIEAMASKISDSITVIKSGSIFPLIENCKVLITFDLSTTILEAQILKKPTISIKLKDYGFGESDIFKTKSCINITINNFEETLTTILTNSSIRTEIIKNGDDFVDDYLANKGRSVNAILKFLEQFYF